MRKTLSFTAGLLFFFAMIIFPVSNIFAAPDGMVVAYVNVPDGWEDPCIWAWDDAGNGAFSAWPGGEAEPDPNNAGWYYCYLPNWAVNIIVNANGGTIQTGGELKANGRDFWVTVKTPDDAEISFNALTRGQAPEYVEKITVYAKVPAGWNNPGLWAWLDPDGTNAFPAWPGAGMKMSGDWYTVKAPSWINSIIINANEGKVQTADLKGLKHGNDVWVVVEGAGSAEVFYENPDFMVPNITVRTKVPNDWENPHLWAWLDPEGSNIFSSWPGQPFTLNGGWYEITIPGWVNSFIVNANGGSVQTGDMKGLDIGRDIWIVVTNADTYAYDYTEISSSSESGGTSGGALIWIVLGAIGVVIIAAIAVIIVKKKK